MANPDAAAASSAVEGASPTLEMIEAGLSPMSSLDGFIRLVRSDRELLEAYLGEIGTSVTLDSTMATVHCRHLLHDGNNRPRVKDLAARLVAEIIDYSIPRSEIKKAGQKFIESNSTRHFAKLHEKAKRLFVDIANTGEGGELLLFLLAESCLRLPQLLCKMPLKTSSHVHFHGTDGIHGAVDDVTGKLSLYWGESKLYDNASNAISACLESLKTFVMPDGGTNAPQHRDLELLSDNLDLNNESLEHAILKYLDPDDPLFNKLEYRGVALVGFDSDKYPPAGSACLQTEIVSQLNSSIPSWHGSASHYLKKHKLTEINIHLFCLPFPSVQLFRDAFLEEMGLK